jgi:hypothetical protein
MLLKIGPGGLMIRRLAALTCCVAVVVPHAALAADDPLATQKPLTASATSTTSQAGPLRRASLNAGTRLAVEAARPRHATQSDRDDRPWIERHPVWTGAMVGFGAGFALTYVATHDDRDEFIKVMSPGAAGIFWGGVCAGVGALAGWGIGRSHDE